MGATRDGSRLSFRPYDFPRRRSAPSWAQSRFPYPTKQPAALLDRFIRASSNEGERVRIALRGADVPARVQASVAHSRVLTREVIQPRWDNQQ